MIDITLNKIQKWKSNIIITTDDEFIIENYKDYKILKRSEDLSNDTASVKDVLVDVIETLEIDNEDIILLYLTYPERTLEDIEKIYKFYVDNHLTSLLCKKQVKTHPYMCLEELENGRGKLVVPHDFYRRQDYPRCFEFSHFVCIFNSDKIYELNDLIMHNQSYFYNIEDKIDIDEEEDLEQWQMKDYTRTN